MCNSGKGSSGDHKIDLYNNKIRRVELLQQVNTHFTAKIILKRILLRFKHNNLATVYPERFLNRERNGRLDDLYSI